MGVLRSTTLQQADSYRDRRNWPKAAELYQVALEKNPQLSHIWVQYGHALKENGEFLKAEAAYVKSLELSPAIADTHLQLGHLKKLMGDMPAAKMCYTRAISIDPELSHAQRELTSLEILINGSTDLAVRRSVSANTPSYSQIAAPNNLRTSEIDVSIVGRFGTSNSIGGITHAFAACLTGMPVKLQGVDTRPLESEQHYKSGLTWGNIYDAAEHAQPSLVSVYCDVIANSPDDQNYKKLPASIVKIAVAVFDASLVPQYWVERLNYFDAIAVLDDCMTEPLRRSGVKRPVFLLPLALEYGSLSISSPEQKGDVDAFVFGCVAGFSARKNLDTLVEVFHETFGGQDEVRLHIHGTLNFSNYYENLRRLIEKLGATNILLTCEQLSTAKYAKLLHSFDAYVNISKGEGFSITPRQAMFLGKPTILSDNTAHKTIVRTGLVVSVRTDHYEPAFFEGLGDLTCGYQCVPSRTDLRRALIHVYGNHRKMSAKSPEMREFAEQYSVAALKWQYATLTHPRDVFFSSKNEINRSYLTTSDASLYEKFKTVRQMRKAAIVSSQRQNIVVPGHDGGFFSVFNTFLSHLVWNLGRSEVTAIVPDWRLERIMQHRKITKFQSFCYGSRNDGNLWLKFFYPVASQEASETLYNNSAFLEEDAVIYDDFNEKNEPLLTYVNAYQLYKSKGFSEWRRWYHNFYREHIKLRDHILAKVDTIVANQFSGDYVIGCHVRHPSHAIEQPGLRMPSSEDYQRKIIQRTAGMKNFKVFLATDQESIISSFRKLFGDRLIYVPDVTRVTYNDDTRYRSLSVQEQMQNGHMIQHLVAADEERWSVKMGDEVLVDALLLASCNSMLHITSNLATAVSFINPDLEMIYCE